MQAVLTVVVMLVVLALPGAVVLLAWQRARRARGRAAPLPGWQAAAAVPVLGVSVALLAQTISIGTGLSWGWPVLVVSTALLAVLLAGISALPDPVTSTTVARPEPDAVWGRAGGRVVAVALLLAWLVGAAVMVVATRGLRAISQDWDAAFHANAIHFIASTGNVDPRALAVINSYDSTLGLRAAVNAATFYYPNGYHALTAMSGILTGAPEAMLLDASGLLIVWLLPVTLLGLLHRFGATATMTAATILVSAASSALVYDLLWRGPLLPYAMGLVLLPAFLMLLHRLVVRPEPGWVVAVGLAAAALINLHPSLAPTAVVFASAMLAQAWWRHRAMVLPGLGWLTVTAAISVLAAATVVRDAFGGSVELSNRLRPADLPPHYAIADLLGFGHEAAQPRWVLAALLLVGLVRVSGLRRLWWLLAASGAFGLLFAVVAGIKNPLVNAIGAPWWDDPWRLVAIAQFGAILLAGHGLAVVVNKVQRWAASRSPAGGSRVLGRYSSALVATTVVFLLATRGLYVNFQQQRLAQGFGDGPTVSSREVEAMRALAERVPDGTRVMNDPFDGSPWMYSIAGLRPVFGHSDVTTAGPDRTYLLEHFNQIDTDPRVRGVARKLDISYVYLAPGFVGEPAPDGRSDGLEPLSQVSSLRQVSGSGPIQVYRLDLTRG